MAEFPALPFFVDAYFADCDHLTDAEHGRYFQLLAKMWIAPQRRFPNDDAWLARRFRRSVEEVRAQLRPLIAEFFHTDGNWIYHKRLEREWQHLSKQREKQSVRAKSRWSKEKGASRGNAYVAYASGISQRHDDSKPENGETGKPLSPKENGECRGNAPTPTPTPTPNNILSESPPTAADGEGGEKVKAEPKKPRGLDRGREPEGFADFYALYPKKEARRDAAKAFAQALQSAPAEEIITGLRRWMAEWRRRGTERQYLPLPASWLRSARWTDEIGTPPQRPPNGGGGLPVGPDPRDIQRQATKIAEGEGFNRHDMAGMARINEIIRELTDEKRGPVPTHRLHSERAFAAA